MAQIETMLEWLWKRRPIAEFRRERPAPAPKPQGHAMHGTYLRLYTYLENRYADTLVLTFLQIEDLLGFALPDEARQRREWWTAPVSAGESGHSDAWVLASRTAVPNLLAGTVAFERSS